jgi:hypothetical protein
MLLNSAVIVTANCVFSRACTCACCVRLAATSGVAVGRGVNVDVILGVRVGEGVPVGVCVNVAVGRGVLVSVGVSVGMIGSGVGDGSGVWLGISVHVGVNVSVGVRVGVGLGVSVEVGVAVAVGVSLGVCDGVRVPVGVGVVVDVAVALAVSVGRGVAVSVCVGVVVDAVVAVTFGVAVSNGVRVGATVGVTIGTDILQPASAHAAIPITHPVHRRIDSPPVCMCLDYTVSRSRGAASPGRCILYVCPTPVVVPWWRCVMFFRFSLASFFILLCAFALNPLCAYAKRKTHAVDTVLP